MFTQNIKYLSKQLVKKNILCSTCESCTGGLVSSAITDASGSSAVFDRSFITYSNEAKMEMLGVKPEILEAHGAVSEQVATEMANGALKNSNAQISVSTTGIAGPTGGTDAKPVGTVHFAAACTAKTIHHHAVFEGNREQVRLQAVEQALKMLIEISEYV